MTNLGDGLIYATIDAALADRSPREARVIALLCEWSGYAAADLAGVKRQPIPTEVIPVRLPCAGRMSAGLALHSFLGGADGVIAFICDDGDCHYRSGNSGIAQLAADTADLLQLLGKSQECFRVVRTKPEDHRGFAAVIREFVRTVKDSRNTGPAVETQAPVRTGAV